jgi:hypothetical protein
MTRIRISLLPAELKRQSSMMKVWTIVALVLAIIALIMLAGNILFNFWLKTPVAELEALKNQNKNMTENIGRLSYIQEMFDEIESNNRIILELQGNKPDWAYLLDETSGNLTIYGVNMSRMKIVAVGEETGCVITGQTNNADNLDVWINHMESLEGVESVSLGEITTEISPLGGLVYNFDAEVTIAKWNQE